ncbi:hypothetical protein CKM354_000010400 [Cercospora kikuchii]|uniref:Uncharacterized protein n=1 Tax=Cercospora kikuchii TaxID=84275 RepID=A0A9P3C565_9PEZI|nr:uncharacterized protein CKM354_000010400 [Cercospora kikuchii]GIZ36634.1 hypothetical protein CKM354_000010400 [Cercospora kikuchii]
MEDGSKLGFWKRLVLAQDLSDSWLEANKRLSVNGYMRARIRAVCTERRLNSEQSAAVLHFCQHRVTVIIGLPGIGKSTLVAAINELLEESKMKYWVRSESNAAVYVLAEKLAGEKQDQQAEGFLRIWPAFSEGYKCDQDDTRILSLEQTIRRRLTARENGRLGRPYWKEEGDQLRSFRSAHDQLASPPEEDKESEDEYEKYLENLRSTSHDALRTLQVGYAATSKGIFSTAAAASGPFLRRFRPQALLMDESSQMTEARAVHSIVLAAQSKLDRVLIIGDPKQLPPAIFSLRNIFLEYGNMSLMERLINAGLRPITLVEQYRMYLSISSIINSTSYNGKLSDGSTVRGREHAARFQAFMAQLATRSKTPFNTAISSITISPERRAALHYVPQMMQSQMMQGSTSRYNVQTAVIVLRTIF